MTRRITTPGDVRSVFALAAEGKMQKEIARVMGMHSAVVSRILRRDSYAEVKVSLATLEAAAKHHPLERIKKQKTPSDKRPPITLDDLGLMTPQSPTMPQAMKAADPQYPRKVVFEPPKPKLSFEDGEFKTSVQPSKRVLVPGEAEETIRYQCTGCGRDFILKSVADSCCGTEERARLKQSVRPVSLASNTKAQALMDLLGSVQHCNELRQEAEELRAKSLRILDMAKGKEDAAFARLAALSGRGFTPAFLNSLLSESGLCTDGGFDVE